MSDADKPDSPNPLIERGQPIPERPPRPATPPPDDDPLDSVGVSLSDYGLDYPKAPTSLADMEQARTQPTRDATSRRRRATGSRRNAPRASASDFGQAIRSIGTVSVAAVVVATLFTWWTPNSFLPAGIEDTLAVALATQSSAALVTPLAPEESPTNRIGLVSGHRGLHRRTGLPDPGAICPDGLTEVSINERVAQLTADMLRAEGYSVDILDEFDSRLDGYKAAALVSIHSDSCEFVNATASGYKVAAVAESTGADLDTVLVSCLVDRYAAQTGLAFHPSVTFDMTQYHTFYEIDPNTPGAIIEIGFLNLDRQLLTEQPERVAAGVAQGILCFMRDEPIDNIVTEGT